MKFNSKMQKYTSSRVLFIFLLSLSFLSNANHIYGNSNDLTLNSVEGSNFISDIIQSLETHAIYENSSLIGWSAPLNSSLYYNETLVFNGFDSGNAGIGDFLLDAYLEGFNQALPLLSDLIEHYTGTYETVSSGIFWPRYANLDSDGWLGVRYGNMGIAKFLARAQYEGIVDNLDSIIEQAYAWVVSEQYEDGSFPISPDSYATTDQTYGSAGIASSLLSIGSNLENQEMSEDALEIADWLLEKSVNEDDTLVIPWTLFGEGTEFNEFRMTGISTGTAGMVKFMLEMFNHTQLTKYYEAAIGLANDLINRDLGGYWPDNIIGYISKLTANSALTGYYGGSSGIAIQLLNIYELSNDEIYLESAVRVEKWIENFVHENGSVSLGTIYPDRFYTGMMLGSAGVAKYYLDLYNKFGISRHYSLSETIIEHLYDLLKIYGTIPVVENDLSLGFSPSIDQGLAGIGKLVLEFSNALKPDEITQNPSTTKYNSLYDTITASTDISNPTGSTSKSGDTPFFTISSIIILVLGTYILQKNKRKKFEFIIHN